MKPQISHTYTILYLFIKVNGRVQDSSGSPRVFEKPPHPIKIIQNPLTCANVILHILPGCLSRHRHHPHLPARFSERIGETAAKLWRHWMDIEKSWSIFGSLQNT